MRSASPPWIVPAVTAMAVFGVCGLLTSATAGILLGAVAGAIAIALVRANPALGRTMVQTNLEGLSLLAGVALIAVLMYEPRGPDWENAGWIATIVFFVLLLASAAQRAVRMRRGGRGS